jgi:hypothetical protein
MRQLKPIAVVAIGQENAQDIADFTSYALRHRSSPLPPLVISLGTAEKLAGQPFVLLGLFIALTDAVDGVSRRPALGLGAAIRLNQPGRNRWIGIAVRA